MTLTKEQIELIRLNLRGILMLLDEILPAHTQGNVQVTTNVETDFEAVLRDKYGGDQPLLVAASDVAVLLRESLGRSVPANKYGDSMRRLGFVDGTARINGKPTWSWRRGQYP